MTSSTKVYNRKTKHFEKEEIAGEFWMRALYENRLGKKFQTWVTHSWISKAYGTYQSSRWSKRLIPAFIKKFNIPMQEFNERSFNSFNDFFIRTFKSGMRNFPKDPQKIGSPAEGRVLAFTEITSSTLLPIKGATLDIHSLLGNSPQMKPFLGGPGVIIRLCPVDYHRFHFPDSGKVITQERKRGPLHSVHPIALKRHGDILFTNERMITILETTHFGRLAYVEVGALCVGKIIQSHPTHLNFKRGEEKGYFLFGGSTVILIGEKGKWEIDSDLIEKTQEGHETRVQLGESIGSAII